MHKGIVILAVVPLLFLAGCASDEADTAAQQSTRTTCLTAVSDKDWNDIPSYSADDIAWFNVPGNFTQYASTCQTAAITALVIGNQYGNGDGVPKDPIENIDWWKRSAALGDSEAEDQLGYLYSVKYGIHRGDDDGTLPMQMRSDQTAFKWWSLAAAHGNAQAANMVASMYLMGIGVAKDDSRAVSILLKLANGGDHTAAWQLGLCYEKGWGCGLPRDKSKARYWLLQAQGNGTCDGCFDTRQEIAELDNPPSEPQDAASGSATNAQGSSQSTAEWQQDHQAKIDELTQEIASHEQQAEQDDADADQAEAQVQQNESANTSGAGGAFLALGNAVEGGLNAGLAEKERQDAADERRQAQEERDQLAELGGEQPPVAQNNSESMALTQMQTQAIQSGNTIEGQVNRARNNLQGAQQQEASALQHEQETQPQSQAPAQQQEAASGSSPSGSGNSNVTYAQPATQCLTYTASGPNEGVGVWATNSCSYEIEMNWATPSAPATGIIILNAGERIFVPHQPVKVFACTAVRRNGQSGNLGIYKTFDSATGQSTPPTFEDSSFICPVDIPDYTPP